MATLKERIFGDRNETVDEHKSIIPDGWVRVTWTDGHNTWKDNIPESFLLEFRSKIISSGNRIIKIER